MSNIITPIESYRKTNFRAQVSTGHYIQHDVYTIGEGAPIVIIQELPGIGPETLRLADEFVQNGFQIVLPHLFGPLGRKSMLGNLVRVFCLRKEFYLFAANKTSPIVDWLRQLCAKIKVETGAKGVGTIGMCLTGNFALAMMADDHVLASVSSQPSMPLFKDRDLHLSSQDLQRAKDRLAAQGPMMGLRFAGDVLCKASKFKAIDEAFNSEKTCIDLKTLPGKGHSVLTIDFVDEDGHPTREILNQVVAYFGEKLK